MRALATLRSRTLPFLVVAALCVLGASGASAQIDPTWDHYKVYNANPKVQAPAASEVFLVDQFAPYQHQVQFLDKFMNPVEKFVLSTGQGFPIIRPFLHYTWWRISPQPFLAQVKVNNQFGTQDLDIFQAEYLLNPALKNDPSQQLPPYNHYKCYLCEGQPISIPLRLSDQFDVWQTQQLFPRYFCNPVQKQVPGQPPFPIYDPRQHYTCYQFQPPDPQTFIAFVRDQFIQIDLQLNDADLLCVPTDKLHVTKADEKSWGRLKMLYR